MLQSLGWCVAVFGSARIQPDTPYYSMAQALGQRLAEAGFPVIAGGGPGLMEAVNKGAYEAKGVSIGLNIELGQESRNPFQTHRLHFESLFARRTTFFMHSAAFVAMPGGIGTLDELFELMTLIQTRKMPPVPLILMGGEFWAGLLNWMRNEQLARGLISGPELDRLIITDDPDEVMRHIQAFWQEHAELLSLAP